LTRGLPRDKQIGCASRSGFLRGGHGIFSVGKLVKHAVRLLVFFLLILALGDSLDSSWGPLTILLVAAIPVLALLCFREIHLFAGAVLGRETRPALYSNLILAVCSAGLVLAAAELFLQVAHERRAAEPDAALTIPEEWKKRPVAVEGSRYSYYWHGILHVHDDRDMRRASPFPEKDESRCRIAVFGDSLTYGYGVGEDRNYPRLIEAALSDRYRVEVLNLGVSGRQSADILVMMREYIPRLDPDLVVYGVCLNDLLDSGEGQGSNRMRYAWSFPWPGWFKRELRARTLMAEILEKAYDNLLLKTGLRRDFFDDILKDFDGYQARFGRDLRQMNTFVQQRGLPPVVAMVLNQYPHVDSRGHKIARVAEMRMREVGVTVAPTEEYYRKNDGREMNVSRWEGHPNEEAHRLFARYLLPYLNGQEALEKCRK
jgi:lysophospholipase L1-like esterase